MCQRECNTKIGEAFFKWGERFVAFKGGWRTGGEEDGARGALLVKNIPKGGGGSRHCGKGKGVRSSRSRASKSRSGEEGVDT